MNEDEDIVVDDNIDIEVCIHCGCELDPYYKVVIHDDDIWCAECHDAKWFTCDDCCESYRIDNMCMFDSSTWCIYCYDNNTFTCDDCGERYHTDEYGDSGYCQRCWDHQDYDNESDDPPHFSYLRTSDSPTYNENERRLYMGFEIEREFISADYFYQDVRASIGYNEYNMWMTGDASLSYGFEIKHAPATIEWYAANMKATELFDTMNRVARVDRSCGMHVHMSRKAFTDDQIYRLVKLFYDNNEQVYKISNRAYLDDMNTWAPIEEPIVYYGLYPTTAKYNAVHVGTRTIELRIFKSPITVQEFWEVMYLCDALFTYTEKYESTKWSDFVEYCNTTPKYADIVDRVKYELPV